MPSRLLCTDVQREDAKPSLDLASWLFGYVPLHKIWYGIHYYFIYLSPTLSASSTVSLIQSSIFTVCAN
jgi:hypothetical protein